MPKKTSPLPNDWREKIEKIMKEWVSPEAFNNSLTILNRPEAQEAAEALLALSSVNNENLPMVYSKLLCRIAAANKIAKNKSFNRTVRQTKEIVKALKEVIDDGYLKKKSTYEEINELIVYYGDILNNPDTVKFLPKTRPREKETTYAILALCITLKYATGRPQHKIASLLMNAARLGVWTEDSVKVRYSDYSYLRKSLTVHDLMTTTP